MKRTLACLLALFGAGAPRIATATEPPAVEAPAQSGWYFTVEGRTFGPFDDASFAQAYRDGQVTDATLVWWDGATAWAPFSHAPRYAEIATMPGTARSTGPSPAIQPAPASSPAAAPTSAPAPTPATAPAAASELPSADAERDDDEVAVGEHAARVFVTPRIGLGFPGVATPHKISTTKVGVGFVLHPDAVVAVGNYFEVGAYFHYSVRAITDRGTAPTKGLRTHLLSIGAVTKVGFDIGRRSRLRIGLMLGYNRTKQGFRNDTFDGNIHANGLNVGPSVEWSVALTKIVGLNVQLAAITQVAGKADLGAIGAVVEDGSKQKMAYPPLAFLAVGVDFGLGSRK